VGVWLKKINLIINNKEIICLKKVESKPRYNTVIILTGAATYASNYAIFAKQFKETEVIIINTPGHGFGKSSTKGEPLTDGNDLIDFQVNVIKQLIKENYCSTKVTLLGYSIGGMTLLNIVNRKLLNENIDLYILFASARFTRYDKAVIKGLYNKETKTFNIKALMDKNCTGKTPWYIKYLNPNLICTLSATCHSDFLECDSMNEISKNELMIDNDKSVIAFLGKDDCFFSEEEMLKTVKSFRYRTVISLKEYGHLFILERPIKAGKLVFKAIKEVTLKG